MAEEEVLNRLEHNLLSMQVDDVEPMFVLYADTVRDVEGATLDLVAQALARLVELGLSRCYVVDKEWTRCERLTFEDLKRRFHGLSEKERREYPLYVPEYYFEITDRGRTEEAKEVYAAYYRDVDNTDA